MMASPYDHGHCWSPPTVRYRSLDILPQMDPISEDGKTNGLLSNEQQVANQLRQLHVHTDAPSHRASSQPTARSNCFERFESEFADASMAEDLLFKRLKQVINDFMVHPGQRFGHNGIMRWKIDYANQVHYTVVIAVDPPPEYSTDIHEE